MCVLNKIKNFILEIFFPHKCIFCDDVIPIGCDEWICPYCEGVAKICCEETKGIMHLYEYKGYVKGMLHRFKYYKHKEYAVKLGELLAERFSLSERDGYDLIVPVPMHIKKKHKRGYNQAELLAEEMGKRLGIDVDSESLIRKEYTKAQSLLKINKRNENVKNVFKVVNNDNIKNKNIILVDDIYTSGSTAKACMKALYEAGALQICVIVVAIAVYNVKNKNFI